MFVCLQISMLHWRKILECENEQSIGAKVAVKELDANKQNSGRWDRKKKTDSRYSR